MLTSIEAAEQLHVSPRTVNRWVANGLLPATQYPSGMVRIKQEDLDDFLKNARTHDEEPGKQDAGAVV